MKLFSAKQIKEWDKFTIANTPISPLDLMERAARAATNWLVEHYKTHTFLVFCGNGNNGGDGLAIARMLKERSREVMVCLLQTANLPSPDFSANLERLKQANVPILTIDAETDLMKFPENSVVIDAIFGTGINRFTEGIAAKAIKSINQQAQPIVSIDLPSGMFADESSIGSTIIKAHHTLTFQQTKLAFLVAENASYFGKVHVLDIFLLPEFLQISPTDTYLLDAPMVKQIYKPRNEFAHKGNHGHALLIGGSFGKVGAMVLAARACLRAGAGLLTNYVPKCGYSILQTTVPEAMVLCDDNQLFIEELPKDLSRYSAIGIGMGAGTYKETAKKLKKFLKHNILPTILDADALNMIAEFGLMPKVFGFQSILTPHPKEFDRLFGKSSSDFDRFAIAKKMAADLDCVIVLKNHHTFIATQHHQYFFNTTGNSGLAKGGSGDSLTGLITALLAQGYSTQQAACLGVFLHGLSADIAIKDQATESLLASDVIENFGKSFFEIQNY